MAKKERTYTSYSLFASVRKACVKNNKNIKLCVFIPVSSWFTDSGMAQETTFTFYSLHSQANVFFAIFLLYHQK